MVEIVSTNQETGVAQGSFNEAETHVFIISALLYMLQKYGPQEMSLESLDSHGKSFGNDKVSFNINIDLEKKIAHVEIAQK